MTELTVEDFSAVWRGPEPECFGPLRPAAFPPPGFLADPAAANQTSRAKRACTSCSDSHIGFNKPANPDVTGTLQSAVNKINALSDQPEFIIHTGDLTHSSKAEEFDTLEQILKGAHTKQIFYVPGEHDTSVDDGKQYLERHGKGSKGSGWYSFDHAGVHFIGLVNVIQLEGL